MTKGLSNSLPLSTFATCIDNNWMEKKSFGFSFLNCSKFSFPLADSFANLFCLMVTGSNGDTAPERIEGDGLLVNIS